MAINKLFDGIAGSYDRFNHVLSLNIDRWWRHRSLAPMAAVLRGAQVLDIACGTADMSLKIMASGAKAVVGVDISEGMLAVGRQKVAKAGLQDKISLQIADCAHLPFADEQFDVVTVAFGVRNFEHRAQCLKEMCRVLKSGGTLLVLEFSTPQHFPIKQLYRFYFKHIMPLVGSLMTGDRAAFDYFFDSVYRFPQGEAFMQELRAAGFSHTKQNRMTFGIATAYYAVKDKDSTLR